MVQILSEHSRTSKKQTKPHEAYLEAEFGLVPHADREEAVQEAWLAHVAGRSPARAVNTFARRERRRRLREVTAACPVEP